MEVCDDALAMGRVTSLMFCHVGSRLSDWLFMNEVDMGGYGILATKLTEEEKDDLLRQGEMEGRTVAAFSAIQSAARWFL